MMEIMNGIQECKEREISRGENNMQNKYSRKQLEELYNCKIFKTTTCNEDNYVFWAAQGATIYRKWRKQVIWGCLWMGFG